MRQPFIRLLALAPLLALVAGCGGTRADSGVRDYLEESTGTSISYVLAPAAFVRGQPGLASSGRDYVYVAPLAVSRGGQRSYWLWLGVWSTVDRQIHHEGASHVSLGTVQLVADGEPMDIEVRVPDARPAGLDRVPYETPVRPSQELVAQLTRSQLQRLGRAQSLGLVDRLADGAPRAWQGDELAVAAFRHFAEEALAAGR
jgi:hypothetical protein